MTVTYSWIILYSCLIFGTGILCDRKLERRQAVSSCSVNTNDTFYCSNGLCIEWQLVCDGHEDCLDGSDETKKLCNQYEFETNMAMDCGRVNIKNQVISEKGHQSIIDIPPWAVDIYRRLPDFKLVGLCSGSIIASNIVISSGYDLWNLGVTSKQTQINDGRYKVGSLVNTLESIELFKHYINVTMIYLPGDYNPSVKNVNIAVLVLANKVSISIGYEPICIDWFGKYNIRKESQKKTIGEKDKKIKILHGCYQYTENKTYNHYSWAEIVTYDMIGIELNTELGIQDGRKGTALGVLYSSNYFLTGISYGLDIQNGTVTSILFHKIKNYVPWIRGIVYKHTTVNPCVLPTVEGVIYSYEGSNEILSHGTLIDRYLNVIENCDVGYHKAYPNGFRFCLGKGKWFASSDKLCFKSICPPLLSDSLDIKCSYNSNYANCSNMSIPGTIATTSCKPTYALSNGQKQTSLELRCLANGTWDNELNRCNPYMNSCVLPTIEGVIYSYEGSNESLSHGTSINLHITVVENCEVGYHKAYPNSFRVCQSNGKWITVSDKLCFKMCPPLESDSLDIKCSHNCKYANCSNLSIPDTIARLSCKPSYFSPYGQEDIPLEIVCQSNGIWNNRLYRCNPYCGKLYTTINNGIISDGKTALKGTAPWNVGVYRFNIQTSNYDSICGGSIISPNLVVSAAHCFWKNGMSSTNISINYGLYKIAVGKYSRNITIIDDEYTKIMNVEIVYLNEHYYGFSGFHADDIAIIVLRNRISFSVNVSPVCVDWRSINTIPNGAEGKIVGWGNTENGIASPILLEASLPYIDHSSCRNMYTNGFERYVTDDKFCAGSKLGQGVLQGDSGAGLSFLHSNSYYLTGVASVKDTDTNDSVAVFTEIKHHIEWIRGLYNKHLHNINGIIAPIETAPWNVGVLRLNNETSNYDLICGGSILSSNLVVSEAHCFLDGNRHFISRNMSINDDRYKIAVGKYDRNFTNIENILTKIMNMKTVYLHEHYDGISGWHFADIAIIVLQNRVSFNNGVTPVCIDWTGKYKVVNGDKGKIVGWGKTEKDIESPFLLEASLPYIDRSTCRKKYTNGFQSQVTADKFCTGSESGQGVRNGDSGAGLSFIHFGLHYLTGVVSVKDPDTNYSIATFTEIKFHIQWIRKLYEDLN